MPPSTLSILEKRRLFAGGGKEGDTPTIASEVATVRLHDRRVGVCRRSLPLTSVVFHKESAKWVSFFFDRSSISTTVRYSCLLETRAA